MATIINTPTSDNNGFGLVLGIATLGIFVLLLIYYGIPAIRSMGPAQINVAAPEINVPTPVVNVNSPELVTP